MSFRYKPPGYCLFGFLLSCPFLLLLFLLITGNGLLRRENVVENKEGVERTDGHIDVKLQSLRAFERDSRFNSEHFPPAVPKGYANKDYVTCPTNSSQLPWTSWSDEKDAYDANIDIFLDWSVASYLFTYLHYKSLETALVSYPKASFTILIVGPNAANYYKINDLMSKHQFQKYKKRGYRISPKIVSTMKPSNMLLENGKSMLYWPNQEIQYCTTKGKKSVHDVKTAPFHVWMYVRLRQLLDSGGGMSFDFSWIHLKPLDTSISSNFKMSTTCIAKDSNGENPHEVLLNSSSSLQNPYYDVFFDPDKSYGDCYTSYYIVLRRRHLKDILYRDILVCILKEYEREGEDSLANCFEMDSLTGGALCLQTVFNSCFNIQHSPSSSNKEEVFASSLLTFDWNSDVSSLWETKELSSSIPGKYDERECLLSPFNTYSESIRAMCPDCFESCLSVVSFANKNAPKRNLEKGNSFHVSALWLGRNLAIDTKTKVYLPFSAAYDNNNVDWLLPPPDSLLHGIIRLTESRLCRPIGKVSAYGSGECMRYSTPLPASFLSRALVSCSLSFVIPGFMKAATSFLFEALTNHPQVLRALKGVNFKETGCYLPPSSSINNTNNPNHRANCFPFVEAHESNFIYGDATVSYASNFHVPASIKKDNPSVKSIFIVRHPISRLKSHFRYSFGLFKSAGFSNINQAIEYALAHNGTLNRLRSESILLLRQLEEGAKLYTWTYGSSISMEGCSKNLWMLYFHFEECRKLSSEIKPGSNGISIFVSNYYYPSTLGNSRMNKKDRVTNSLFRASIYFPVVAHWCRIMSPQKVLIIENENVKYSKSLRADVNNELKRLHRFLNISEVDNTAPGQVVHKTRDHRNTSVASLESLRRLTNFFEPFNELMDHLLKTIYHRKRLNYNTIPEEDYPK